MRYVGYPDIGTGQLAVGPLTPLAQHYWAVRVTDEYWQCPEFTQVLSPVQSFTTDATVPTERTTWGRVKALYR